MKTTTRAKTARGGAPTGSLSLLEQRGGGARNLLFSVSFGAQLTANSAFWYRNDQYRARNLRPIRHFGTGMTNIAPVDGWAFISLRPAIFLTLIMVAGRAAGFVQYYFAVDADRPTVELC